MKTGIVIQVRMGSTRFPGKVLKILPENALLGWPVLYWVVAQCQRTGHPVIVATSTNEEDDAVEKYCKETLPTARLFRGDPVDVLDRLYQCAMAHNLEEIIRITGDCPFICPEVIDQVITLRRLHNADYASNVDPPSWPDGLDCQVVTFDALQRAWNQAKDPTDRDTVLQYIVHRRREFNSWNLTCQLGDLSKYRWVLDTEDDYKRLSELASCRGMVPGYVNLPMLLDVAPKPEENEPDLRNERYNAHRALELKARSFTSSMIISDLALRIQPYGASTYSKSHVAWGHGGPLYVTHAQGSKVWDVDGNEFIDMTASLGTSLLGHSAPAVRAMIERQLDFGVAFPLAHEAEPAIARTIINRVAPEDPGNYRLVFGKNGSDVTTAAVRVARVFTGRIPIIKIEGHYHGWHDWALDGTHRGDGCAAHTGDESYPLGWEMMEYERVLDAHCIEIDNCAAVIMEPDRVPVDALKDIIKKCAKHGTLVIFDEMVTAFHYAGITYANMVGVFPDLICFGKALGNGMPITCLIGSKQVMRNFVTTDATHPFAFYSGTHFGEMCSMAAAMGVIETFTPERLRELCMKQAALGIGLDGDLDILSPQYHQIPRVSFTDVTYPALYRREMAHRGVLVYSLMMPTLAHSTADLQHVIDAHKDSIATIRKGKARGALPPGSGIMRS